MKLDREQMRTLLRLVAATKPEEINCDEFLGHVARYLESLGDEEPVPANFEELRQHLEVCPECREEFEAMVHANDE